MSATHSPPRWQCVPLARPLQDRAGGSARDRNGRSLAACPFCTALAPSLSQLREQADVVALAEVEAAGNDGRQSTLRVHRVLKGADRVGAGPAR